MPLGMEVGLGPGDCVRWGPRSLPKKGVQPPKIFGPCLLWPHGWMDQDGISMEVGLSPVDFVLDGDPAPLPKRSHFYCGQTAGCIKMTLAMEVRYEVGLSQGTLCAR